MESQSWHTMELDYVLILWHRLIYSDKEMGIICWTAAPVFRSAKNRIVKANPITIATVSPLAQSRRTGAPFNVVSHY